jgi:hypothetical protein
VTNTIDLTVRSSCTGSDCTVRLRADQNGATVTTNLRYQGGAWIGTLTETAGGCTSSYRLVFTPNGTIVNGRVPWLLRYTFRSCGVSGTAHAALIPE